MIMSPRFIINVFKLLLISDLSTATFIAQKISNSTLTCEILSLKIPKQFLIPIINRSTYHLSDFIPRYTKITPQNAP